MAGVGIAVVIWASAAFAGFESICKLIEHGHTVHVAAGIAGAVLGIVGNQAVAWYKLRVGKRINSATLIAEPGIPGWMHSPPPVLSPGWSLSPSASRGATRWPGWR